MTEHTLNYNRTGSFLHSNNAFVTARYALRGCEGIENLEIVREGDGSATIHFDGDLKVVQIALANPRSTLYFLRVESIRRIPEEVDIRALAIDAISTLGSLHGAETDDELGDDLVIFEYSGTPTPEALSIALGAKGLSLIDMQMLT